MITPDMGIDWTMWNYTLTTIVCIYGAVLFAWWARKAGNPSAVFLYVMAIFLGVGWATGVAMLGRFNEFYVLGGESNNQFIKSSIWWATRTVPLTIVLTALCTHMSIRVYSNHFRASRQFQRSGD